MSTGPTRILFAAHSGCQGGAELCLDTTLGHLDRERFRATVLFGGEGPVVERARAMGHHCEVQPLGWWMCYDHSWWQYKNALVAGPLRIWRLARRIKREKIDLVYSNTAVIYEAAVAARLAGVPHVWHVHEVLTPEHMRPRMLPLGTITRWIGRLSDAVIFESDSARQICRKWIAEDKMHTVYNSVRFPIRFPPGEGAGEVGRTPEHVSARTRFDLHDDECAVAWIGRFSERKDPLALIRAAAQMKHAPRCRFFFVGEGPLESEISAAIEQSGLGPRCRMLPFQDDVRPLLEAADLLVLTSREESFGLVLVEAAACGKPAVATRSQGPAEIVVDGQTGRLVPVGDETALATAIDGLVENPRQRQQMGRAAAEWAAEQFSPEKNTRRIEAILEEVLDTVDTRRSRVPKTGSGRGET